FPAVLRGIVDAARDLVDARFSFLHTFDGGAPYEYVRASSDWDLIGTFTRISPDGTLLDNLIMDRVPVRYRDVAAHVEVPHGVLPSLAGGFIGVPIDIRDRPFGNLYLLGKHDADEFSSDDQELVVALVTSASLAIDNARLYERSIRRQRWLAAS